MADNQNVVIPCRKFYMIIESAQNLPNVREIFKTRAYAKVSIGSPEKKIKLKTPSDNRNALNPMWNHSMAFDISDSGMLYYSLSVVIKLYTARTLGKRYIGEVHTTVKDLYDYAMRSGSLSASQSLSIRHGTEATDGVLNFRYSFGETFNVQRNNFLKKPLEFVTDIVKEGVTQILVYAALAADAS